MANLKQQFADYDEGVEKTRPQYSALLGKTRNVVEHPTRNGFCYARMADNLNELITVFNDKVSQVYNLPILVERRGNNWYVVGRDTARYSDWGNSTAFIPKHAKQHEFNRDEGTGADAVFIYPDQIMPLLVYPSGSSGINANLMVAPYMLQRNGSFAYVGGTGTQDILMYKPLDDQAILGLVYLDKVSGNPGFIIASGTTFDGSYTGTSQIAPYLPYPSSTDHEPLYFVRLTSGTSSLGWNNLYNARQFVGGMGGSATTGSSGVSDHEALTGLLGGAPADHYHLTQSQISGLVSGSSTTLHSHPGASLPVFITGSVPFSGADGVLTENNSEFFWSDTYKSLWLGKPAIPFLQSALFPLVLTAPDVNLGVTSGGLAFGTGTAGSPSASWNAYRSRGTYETPTPVQNGDALGTLIGAGYGGAGWISATRQRFYANANWVTGSNYESRIEWEITPSGSTTRRVGMTLYGDSVNIPTGTYNIGGVPLDYSNLTGDPRLSGDEATLKIRRDNARTLSIGFDDNSLPAGYGWAGAPFATPSTVDLTVYPSMLYLTNVAAQRNFLYTTTIPATTTLPIILCGWALGNSTGFVGLRFDDGSDNNYFEWLLSGDLKGTMRTRVGGGVVATVQGSAMPIPQMYGLRANRTGTKYTSWGANLYFTVPWQGALIQGQQAASATTNATWTPTRFGILFDNSGTLAVAIDAIYDL